MSAVKASVLPCIHLNIVNWLLLTISILYCGTQTKADAALVLLGKHIDSKTITCRISAIIKFGLAYVGLHQDNLSSLLLPFVSGNSQSMEIVLLTILALGFIFIKSSNGEIAWCSIAGAYGKR